MEEMLPRCSDHDGRKFPNTLEGGGKPVYSANSVVDDYVRVDGFVAE